MKVVRRGLKQVLPGEENHVYRQFVGMILTVFAWFGVLLTFLSIIGLEGLAAALGTATGFLALGVSYALKDMVADAVSGVYLLRDPDFMPGQRVTIGSSTGVVEEIELRKTRLIVGGDVVVLGNSKIEANWTRHLESDDNRVTDVAQSDAPSEESTK